MEEIELLDHMNKLNFYLSIVDSKIDYDDIDNPLKSTLNFLGTYSIDPEKLLV